MRISWTGSLPAPPTVHGLAGVYRASTAAPRMAFSSRYALALVLGPTPAAASLASHVRTAMASIVASGQSLKVGVMCRRSVARYPARVLARRLTMLACHRSAH